MRVFGHGRSDGQRPVINTPESWPWCRELGVDGVELDVRLTRDGHLVAHHDADLPDGRAIASTDVSGLPRFVPSVEGVLDACRGVTVNLEIKNYPTDPAWDPAQLVTHAVTDLLECRHWLDDVVISCFDFTTIDAVRERTDRVQTAMLYFKVPDPVAVLADVVDHGHGIVHPFDRMVDEAFMTEARRLGLAVNVWVGPVSRDRIRELAQLGVDAIITEQIDDAVAVRDA